LYSHSTIILLFDLLSVYNSVGVLLSPFRNPV